MKENMKIYDKLIRDKIPEIIEADGKKFIVHATEGESLKSYALRKLQEEVQEFIENPCAEEAADVMEIFHFICQQYGIRDSEVAAQTISKRVQRGGFDRGLVLCWAETE